MKTSLAILFCFSALHAAAQDKYNYVSFNKLMEVSGTSYVVATIEDLRKLGVKNRYLLFIDTKTGQSTQVDLPKGGSLENIEQVRIDALDINQILVSARTVDLNHKAGINWNDPTQILILSPDGKQRTQLTDSSLFVRTWAVNSQTGTLVVTGHYDTNSNGKYDKTDKNEIGIYDLKTLKLIQRI